MTILSVKIKGKNCEVSWPADHPNTKKIDKWLKNVSPGYTEYLLLDKGDPHCSACRDTGCENMGMGDDACRAFKFGEKW